MVSFVKNLHMSGRNFIVYMLSDGIDKTFVARSPE